VLIGATVLGAFALAFHWLKLDGRHAVTVSFLTLAFSRLWHVFNMREHRSSIFKNDVVRNPYIWGALTLCSGLLLLAVYVPALASVLRLTKPNAQEWALILGSSMAPFVVGQIFKYVPLAHLQMKIDRKKSQEIPPVEAVAAEPQKGRSRPGEHVRGLIQNLGHISSRSIQYLRSSELMMLLAAIVIISCTWGFIELTDEMLEGEMRRFDVWAVEVLRDPGNPAQPRGPAWLANAVRDITALGGEAVLTLVTVLVAGFLLIQRKYGMVCLVLAAALGGMWITSFLKWFFERERPGIPHLVYAASMSYPSGHAMVSAAVYLSLAALLASVVARKTAKVYMISGAMLITILVGFSRVYLGVHYPTDVLAGWLAGLIWALLLWLVARYLQLHGKVESD
jgi:undecaprenyl-diphosphatase